MKVRVRENEGDKYMREKERERERDAKMSITFQNCTRLNNACHLTLCTQFTVTLTHQVP